MAVAVELDKGAIDEASGESGQEISSDDQSKQVYVACIMQGQRLGIACYDASSSQLQVTEAWEDAAAEDFPCLQLLKFQLQPAVIFTTSKADEAFFKALQQPVTPDGEAFEVKLVKSSAFSYEQAKHRMSFLQWSGMPGGLTDQQRIQLLTSIINFEHEVQVRAAGGLLAVLQQEMIIDEATGGEEDDDGRTSLRVGEITQLSLDDYLTVDAAAYDALQIFQVEKHASSMGIGKAKEGFSVFGVANKCVTQGGRKLLRLWFLRPIVKLEIIEDRQATIGVLMTSPDLMEVLQEVLKHIKDIPKLIQKLGSASMLSGRKDWEQLQESTAYLLQMRELFELGVTQGERAATWCNLSIAQSVLEAVNDGVAYVRELITGVIDFDQTCGETTETLIAAGICKELDELKSLYEGLPDFLNQVAVSELREWPKEVQEREAVMHATIEYMPQVGYLLRLEGTRPCMDLVEDIPEVTFAFEGDDLLGHGSFYHTGKTKELDNVLGDVFHKILDMESALLRDLAARVLEHGSALCKAAAVAAEVDCFVSLALCARENKYVRPTLTRSNVLQIKSGRHMLQEMTVDTFVPNSTNISAEGRICVITGPNYSGKSIYAKQVALIIFLAHIGAYVPADEATIGITDRIFTRIASKESVVSGQSTFMTDLKQMSAMLRHATSRSLCIVDEFGKGTLTADGFGLLCASLGHMAAMAAPPKMLVCTHFCEITESLHLASSKNIAFYTMSILEPDSAQQAAKKLPSSHPNRSDEVVFLYRLVPGRAKESFGIHCAELAGVPAETVARAQQIGRQIKDGAPIERLNSSRTVAKDRRYKDFVGKLLALDCAEGDVDKFIEEVRSTYICPE